MCSGCVECFPKSLEEQDEILGVLDISASIRCRWIFPVNVEAIKAKLLHEGHCIVRKLLTLPSIGGNFSIQRLGVRVVIGERPSTDAHKDRKILLDRFQVGDLREQVWRGGGVHRNDVERIRIDISEREVDMRQCVQRQIGRFDLVARLGIAPGLVVSNNSVVEDGNVRASARRRRIQDAIALAAGATEVRRRAALSIVQWVVGTIRSD